MEPVYFGDARAGSRSAQAMATAAGIVPHGAFPAAASYWPPFISHALAALYRCPIVARHHTVIPDRARLPYLDLTPRHARTEQRIASLRVLSDLVPRARADAARAPFSPGLLPRR